MPFLGKAGYKWLQSFLRRQKDITIRQSENISVARAVAMSRETVTEYFSLLDNILTEYELHDKPGNIYNTDEAGLQLNCRAGSVLAEKGSKNVTSMTSGEKGETISVLTCCNAEGVFLPPYCIFKGKNKKDELLDGMPPGSAIRMSPKSAYVNSDIFFEWLKTHFLPRKMLGKVLLILDGHTSHTTNLEMLEFAEQNDILLFCLPAHTTHYLQPLDRTFFKALKTYYSQACRHFVKSNTSRTLKRLQFGKLLGESWNRAATVDNAVAAFRATGIVPFNPTAIPDYAYIENVQVNNTIQEPNTVHAQTDNHSSQSHKPSIEKEDQAERSGKEEEKETPGKLLELISPTPLTTAVLTARKRGRSIATLLTSEDNLTKRRELNSKKEKKTS